MKNRYTFRISSTLKKQIEITSIKLDTNASALVNTILESRLVNQVNFYIYKNTKKLEYDNVQVRYQLTEENHNKILTFKEEFNITKSQVISAILSTYIHQTTFDNNK